MLWLSRRSYVLLRIKDGEKNRGVRRNLELDALDIVDQKPLWSDNFPKQAPSFGGSPDSGSVIFTWSAGADGLRGEVSRSPVLHSLWDKEQPKDTDFLLEALDSHKGTLVGGVVLHSGKWSYIPEPVVAMGEWFVVSDNHNRVLLYTISTGLQKARWFGYRPEVSRNGQRLCLVNGRGHLIVYDLQGLKPLEDLYFATHISAHRLSSDGQRLFVLTDDQTAFEF